MNNSIIKKALLEEINRNLTLMGVKPKILSEAISNPGKKTMLGRFVQMIDDIFPEEKFAKQDSYGTKFKLYTEGSELNRQEYETLRDVIKGVQKADGTFYTIDDLTPKLKRELAEFITKKGTPALQDAIYKELKNDFLENLKAIDPSVVDENSMIDFLNKQAYLSKQGVGQVVQDLVSGGDDIGRKEMAFELEFLPARLVKQISEKGKTPVSLGKTNPLFEEARWFDIPISKKLIDDILKKSENLILRL